MINPLLATKLYIPPPRSEWVPRPRLIKQLNTGTDCKLTIVSAPAGFGKTTLLSAWVAQSMRPVAWVSLDKGDNDLPRFLAYLFAALQRINVDIGKSAQSMLHSPPIPPFDTLLTGLINEIAETSEPFTLVLDDYHEITDKQAHGLAASILEDQPPQMHVIISSRADPPWPLARLRGRGELSEIRANDLRFTTQETATFLSSVLGFYLSPEDITTLEDRTEGWIAGLQLAALSLQGHEDVSGFIQSFHGTHRFILDYLVEEVLDRQPRTTQEFLLKTAILERMTAPLCDSVTERSDSQTILNQLDQDNLFLIPLDDERRWYRYHHLFSDLLQIRLEQTQPDIVLDLHRRASAWYERNGLIAEAVSHSSAADDVEQVARLVEGNILAMLDHGELASVGGWLDALPDQVVKTRPWLCLAHAWTRVYTGPLEAVEPLLRDAERALTEFAGATAETQHISGHIAAIRAYSAVLFRDLSQVGELAQAALSNLPKQDLMARGVSLAVLATALRNQSDFVGAEQALVEAIAVSQATGKNHVTVTIMCDLAEQLTVQGQLHRADITCRDALKLASADSWQGKQRLPVAGLACTCLSHVLREWNDMESALRYAREGVELSEKWGWAEILVKGHVALARVLQATRNSAAALEAIEHARSIANELGSDFGTNLVGFGEARIRFLQGDVAAAARWAAINESGLSVRDKSIVAYPGRHLLWARILIAQDEHDNAFELLAWLLQEAESSQAVKLQILASLLQSIILHTQGDQNQALILLERALVLAEPEGYVRTFIEEGIPMGKMLRQAVVQGIAVGYAGRLLAALEMETKDRLGPRSASLGSMVEPLSQRELQVLRLLNTHLSSREIASELVISVNTTRSHIKRIYSKLNVHSRRDAIQRARELELL